MSADQEQQKHVAHTLTCQQRDKVRVADDTVFTVLQTSATRVVLRIDTPRALNVQRGPVHNRGESTAATVTGRRATPPGRRRVPFTVTLLGPDLLSLGPDVTVLLAAGAPRSARIRVVAPDGVPVDHSPAEQRADGTRAAPAQPPWAGQLKSNAPRRTSP